MHDPHVDPAQPRLAHILQLLRLGWRIDPPILSRPTLIAPAGVLHAFELLLRHQDSQQVLALPDTPLVRETLQLWGLPLVDL